ARAGRCRRPSGGWPRTWATSPRTEAPVDRLQPGDPAPPFALPDQDGNTVELSGFKGRKLLVYFYPKADTSGCTAQACGVGCARATPCPGPSGPPAPPDLPALHCPGPAILATLVVPEQHSLSQVWNQVRSATLPSAKADRQRQGEGPESRIRKAGLFPG